MGWSEQYWEDVKSELEQSATESDPTSEDETLDQPLDATGAELVGRGPAYPDAATA